MPVGTHTCADCSTTSPETELSYSLTLGMAGWRETRGDDGHGGVKSEWRCPTCWAQHKRATRAKTQFNLPTISAIGGSGRTNRKEDE